MAYTSKHGFPKCIPQGLVDLHSHYEQTLQARGEFDEYKKRSGILYKLFMSANPGAIFESLEGYNNANKLDSDYFAMAFEAMLLDALGLTSAREWNLMKSKDRRAVLEDIGKDISKLIGKLKRHNLDLSIKDHIEEGLLESMQIYEGSDWRPAKECFSLELTSLCDVIASAKQEFESYDSSSLIIQPGNPNVKVHFFNRRFSEFMFYEYGEIDYALIADVASIYFPDKDIDADTVRFQLRPLIQKELDK